MFVLCVCRLVIHIVVFDCCATLLTVASDSPTEEGRVTIEKLKKEGGEIVLFIHCTLYSRALKNRIVDKCLPTFSYLV